MEEIIHESGEEGAKCELSDHSESSDSNSIAVRKVFIAGLPEHVKTGRLKEIFQKFGKVLNVYVPRNLYSNHKNKYGFVTFEDPESAKKALDAKKIFVSCHPVFIHRAKRRYQPVKVNGKLIWNIKHPLHPYSVVTQNLCAEFSDGLALRRNGNCSMAEESMEHDSIYQDQVSCGNGEKSDECKIDVLDNDSLRYIFLFLTKRELIKIERVCKRWQTVSLSAWSAFSTVSLSDFNFSLSDIPSTESLQYILKRCGKFVRNLNVSFTLNRFNVNSVRIIAENCSMLQELNIGNIALNSVSVSALSRVVENLEVLEMRNCTGVTDSILARLFYKCKKLKYLDVSDNRPLYGKCLKHLNPTTLEVLIITDSYGIEFHHFLSAIKRLGNLKRLEFNSTLPIEHSEHLSAVCEALPNLEHLKFTGNFLFDILPFTPTLGKFTNLQSLNVNDNDIVNDRLLEEIIRSCVNIRKLYITGCGSNNVEYAVTDASVSKLAALSHLEDLALSYLRFVTDKSLEALALIGKLRRLEIRGNCRISDIGCGKIASLCENLELFDLSGCDLVGDQTVIAADANVMSRSSEKPLELVVGGTSVSAKEHWGNLCPLLKLNYMDFCVESRRFDRLERLIIINYPLFESEDDDDDQQSIDLEDLLYESDNSSNFSF